MTVISEPRAIPDQVAATTPRAPGGGRWRRLWRGRPGDPAWVRPSLVALLVATAILYLWGLGASGWANSFYSAAVQAGTKSWKAFFFGSSDAANSISVDKSPAFLWPMELSARIFGVSSWSILVPQALEGVAAVGILYATVRRWFAPAAGLLAGGVLALTPVAALMFRFNNPDSMLVLLLVLGAYAMVRAVESGRTHWLVLAGACVGFGFLAKMLQAFLVVPAFGAVYLLAAPGTLVKRIRQLVVGGVALVVSAGWWVAAVELTPAADRPYVGGSQNNSVLNLIFGYNGFGRLTGSESGSVGGNGPAGGRWGPTGWTRLFNRDFGTQISWLLPAALILLVAGLLLTWSRRRNDRTRAALVLWGGWLLVTGAAISFGQGIIHPYYTVALAPAIGAIVGIVGVALWQRRDRIGARAVLAATVATTGVWSYVLLDRTPSWRPGLRGLVLVGGLAAAFLVLVWGDLARGVRVAIALGAIAVGLAGPAAYAIDTASTPHAGAIPSAGPSSGFAFGFGGPGGRRFGGLPPAVGGNRGFPGFAGNAAGAPPGVGGFGNGQARNGRAGVANGFPPGALGRRGAIGGLLSGSRPSSQLVTFLKRGAHGHSWVAATVGANEAAGYQLATDEPVMPIGGFNGSDPSPTLAQFERYVREGRIHYFIGGGRGGFGAFGGGATEGSRISAWVRAHFTVHTVGGVTLYDLTSGVSASAGSSS